jgi:transposase
MIKGIKAEIVVKVLLNIPLKHRGKVKEVTPDMTGNMGLIVKKSFPNAVLVIGRFHVQKLVLDALQEIRIKFIGKLIDTENDAVEIHRNKNLKYSLELILNGDIIKQLLARSRCLLYKSINKWTQNQQ